MVKTKNSNKELVLVVDTMKPLQVILPPDRMRMKKTPRKKKAVQSPKKIAEKDEVKQPASRKRTRTIEDEAEKDEVKQPASRKRTRTIEDEEDEVKQSPTKRMTRSVTQQERDSHKMDKKEKKNDKKKGLSPVKQKKNDNKEKDKKKNIQEEEVEDEDEEKEEEEEEQVHKPTKKEANQKTRCSPKTRGKKQKQVAKRTAVKTQKKKGKKKVKKEVKEEVKPKPKQIQYRSSFQSFVKLLKDIKFTTLQKEKIRKTQFANLIFALVDESLTEAYLRKSDLHALSLIRRYEGSGGRFNLGTKSVKITAQEFALVFGIPYGPNRIKPTTKPRMPETRFANEICVRGGRIMTNSSLKEYFQKAVKTKDEESANDVARVLTLYLISTVFLPSTASRVS
ncbi:uncharacterized protein LOC131298579 [Rhododendron vialii]|uniref:uncharacterized protein LOC131298579 n=1 Tax=Rhododendron vialii TaxID=182163 RepID=UPI00265E7BE2|nr:uncharacterized protein LOC131298579 [Rhododendron vialii]